MAQDQDWKMSVIRLPIRVLSDEYGLYNLSTV